MRLPLHDHLFLTILHSLIIYGYTVLSTAFFGLLAISAGFFSKTGDSVHNVAHVWGKSILWISGIRVEISGMEHIDPRQSYIYMSNHQSNFDIPVLLSKLKVQFRWLAKAELFKIPLFGQAMRGAGYISIDRADRKSAFESLARAAQSIRNGTSVLVFPEGTRSPTGLLLPFKKGGFVLAVDAGVPIVPVVIEGSYAIMSKKSYLIRRRPVQVWVGPPIETSGYTRKTKEDLMQHVRAVMTGAFPAQSAGGGHA